MHAFDVLTPALTDEQQRRYDETLRRARLDKAKRVGAFRWMRRHRSTSSR